MRRLVLAAAVGLCALPTQVTAVPLLFDFSGLTGLSEIQITWTMDDQPTPSAAVDGSFFRIDAVSTFYSHTFGGVPFSATLLQDLTFSPDAFSPSELGGERFIWVGDRPYSGSESSPTFRTGDFRITPESSRSDLMVFSVRAVPLAVPEPASWALMLGGFAIAGVALRARRTPTQIA